MEDDDNAAVEVGRCYPRRRQNNVDVDTGKCWHGRYRSVLPCRQENVAMANGQREVMAMIMSEG